LLLTNRIKKILTRSASFAAATVIAINVILTAVPVGISAERAFFQIGYTFDYANVNHDMSGHYDILDTAALQPIAGREGYGNKSFAYLSSDIFASNPEFTVAFWAKMDSESSFIGKSIFYASSYSIGGGYLDISYTNSTQTVTATYFSGTRACSVSARMPADCASSWNHITVSLGASGENYYLNIYVNGTPSASSRAYESMESFIADMAYFTDYSIDDIYMSNRCLSDGDVSVLAQANLSSFMKYKDPFWTEADPTVPSTPIDPDQPDIPDIPIIPGIPVEPSDPYYEYYVENPDRFVTPVSDFSWSAYIFENSFDVTKDLNGKHAARYSALNTAVVNTDNYKGSFGKGIARRWGSYPSYVLALNEGLLYSANSFTVGAWIYFEAEGEGSEVVQTTKEINEETGEEIIRYTYYNKKIPALKGTGIEVIYDLYGQPIDINTCFTYDEYGQVIEQSVMYAYDEDGRLLDLINGKYLVDEGRYYMSELGILYDATTMLPYFGTPVWEDIPKAVAAPETTALFDFVGQGILSFNPSTTGDDGKEVATLTYGANRNYPTTVTVGKASSLKGKWVHYAMSFDRMGVVKIYTNGKLSYTANTGLKLADLKLCNLYLLSDSTEDEGGRFILDEVYVSSKVLSAAEMRKLRYYGISRYSTEALADPDPDSEGSQPSDEPENGDVDLRPDETDELEDAYIDTAAINGFIGTSFDDSTLIGKDYNNSASAVIRNASLKQGIKTYGLALNGINSYIRYPIGILDAADAVTVSIAYNWSGITTNSQKSQKLFDFSNKTQSVESPSAYISLAMGDGMSGLELKISDGTNTTTLNSNINVTNKWVRATVVIADGKVLLYLDETLAASSSTKVDVSKINPNYNYVGKSGVKGDPLFCGAVDEIYISRSAISEADLEKLVSDGVEPVEKEKEVEEEEKFEDVLWDNIIKGVLIATGLLVLVIIIIPRIEPGRQYRLSFVNIQTLFVTNYHYLVRTPTII